MGHPCDDGGRSRLVRRRACAHASRLALAEDAVKGRHEPVGVARREAHGRLDLQHVVERAVGADEHAAGRASGSPRCRRSVPAGSRRDAVAHQLDADEQAEPAHVADERVTRPQPAQAAQQVLADLQRMVLQALVAITSSTARPIAHETGLPPKVLKYSMPLAKASRDLGRRDHGAERVAVADGLAHGDDVGHDALGFEGPEVAMPTRPKPTCTSSAMHTPPAARTALVRGAQVARRQDDLPAAAQDRLRDERADAPAARPRCDRRPRRRARAYSRAGVVGSASR